MYLNDLSITTDGIMTGDVYVVVPLNIQYKVGEYVRYNQLKKAGVGCLIEIGIDMAIMSFRMHKSNEVSFKWIHRDEIRHRLSEKEQMMYLLKYGPLPATMLEIYGQVS